MDHNYEAFQHLLEGIRESFIDELAELCNHLENLIISLEHAPDDQEAFNRVFMAVHSLKISSSIHGVGIVSNICHHLENFLSDTLAKHAFNPAFTGAALSFVDLLRRSEAPARNENPDFTTIEGELEQLRLSTLQSRKSILIAESSSMMSRIFQKTLTALPVQSTLVNNGLAALDLVIREPFDLLIVGRELKDLNGIAVLSALRLSQGRNQDIPALLVTSNHDGIPEHIRVSEILPRDSKLEGHLREALGKILT